MKYFLINYKDGEDFKKLITKASSLDLAESWFENKFSDFTLIGIVQRDNILDDISQDVPAYIGQIRTGNKFTLYFDKYGRKIDDKCLLKYPNGEIQRVYRTVAGELGIDATNPVWIENGRAFPCEFGIYPFEWDETMDLELVEESDYEC